MPSKKREERTWVEIDLDAIANNYAVARSFLREQTRMIAVVKANAYGNGAPQVARLLEGEPGVYGFGVASFEEGMRLRRAEITKPILILGYVDETDMDTIAREHITAPIYDRETAELLSAAAVRTGETITVHYKLDTGMTRLGFPSWERAQTVEQIAACAALPGLRSEGIFTHFAVADVPEGEDYTNLQYQRFAAVCDDLAARGVALPLQHCANSGAIQSYARMHCTMTRAGIILYGYRPDASVPPVLDLRPAMTVKARVVQVRDIPAHTTVSYGRTYETDKPTRMAVVSVGYADGFLRTGSGKAHVVLGGQKAPVLGRICMDMCMVRVPDGVAVHRGDEVTVFGPSVWTAEDVAEAAGTISYEVVCAVSSRVPRFYPG